LGATGYGWCRVSFRSTASTLLEKFGRWGPSLAQPFLFGSVVAIPLSQTGFGPASIELMRRYMDTDRLVALCGHPFQALDSARGENSEHVDRLAEYFREGTLNRTLKFCTMAEVEKELRAPSETELGRRMAAVL
jgi:hypothetical protein